MRAQLPWVRWVLTMGCCTGTATPARTAPDWRDVVSGGYNLTVAPGQYYNQPQLARLSNGSWIAVLTNAGHSEGLVYIHPPPKKL